MREMDKLHELYESLAEARREVGEDAVPFHKFAELVKRQVEKLQAERQRRSGVSGGGEGREGELYGAGAEGGDGLEAGAAEGRKAEEPGALKAVRPRTGG